MYSGGMHTPRHRGAVGGQRRHSSLLGTLLNIQLVVPRMVRVRGGLGAVRGGVRSGPGEARTILLLHIISVRPSKQPLMVRTFLKVYMDDNGASAPIFCFCKNKPTRQPSAVTFARALAMKCSMG